MSHAPSPHVQAPAADVNGLGIAGFIVSLVGLVGTGGLLSPIGLVLSLIALNKRPRGFAVAGVVIGLIGSCGVIAAMLFFGGAILLALGIAAVALSHSEQIQLTYDFAQTAIAIKEYENENGVLPATLAVLGLPQEQLIDPWGTRYAYHFSDSDEAGFDLISAGADREFETEDDVLLSQMGRTWKTGGVSVTAGEEVGGGGRTSVRIGELVIEASGDDEGGRVVIRDGDREVLVVEGDERGGSVSIAETAGPPPAPETPDEPEAPEGE